MKSHIFAQRREKQKELYSSEYRNAKRREKKSLLCYVRMNIATQGRREKRVCFSFTIFRMIIVEQKEKREKENTGKRVKTRKQDFTIFI